MNKGNVNERRGRKEKVGVSGKEREGMWRPRKTTKNRYKNNN